MEEELIQTNINSILNFTDHKNAFTNWDFSVEHNVDSFNETRFSQIDYKLIKPKEVVDSLYFFSDIQHIVSVKDSIETTKTYTEISNTNEISNLPQGAYLKSNNGLLLLLLVSILIVGFVRLNWKDYINNLFRSILFQGAERKISGYNISNTSPAFILTFLFFFNSTLFIYEIYKLTDFITLNIDLLLIPIVFFVLLILFSVKNTFLRFIGNIFQTLPLTKSYIRNSTILGQAFSIIILPVIGLIPFLTETIQLTFFKIGILTFIALYLIQIGRGIKIIFKETFSLYYIFLYLCALEILPLLCLISIISNQLD